MNSDRVTIYRKRDVGHLMDPVSWDLRLPSGMIVSRLAWCDLPRISMRKILEMFSDDDWAELYEEESVRRKDLPFIMVI